MELWHIKTDSMTNITPLIGKISWRSNKDELGDEVTFDIAFNDVKYFPKNPVGIGSFLSLRGKNELFRGITITENKVGRNPIGYTSFDYAFYLNKSKSVYQFENAPANNAVLKLLNDFSVPVGNIALDNVSIDKIYVNDVISDIIKNIIEQVEQKTGKKYLMEMRSGKFYIENRANLIIKTSVQLASNIAPIDGIHTISEPSRTRSIENMKNSIQIVKDNKLLATVKNDSLINDFGLLQDVIIVDKSLSESQTVANNMLKELGKIFEENSIPMLGDENVRAGRLLEVNEPVTGMNGIYLIKSVNHTFENGIHKMVVDLEVS